MFAITFMCIALFDELLFRMRCRQLRREAREADLKNPQQRAAKANKLQDQIDN